MAAVRHSRRTARALRCVCIALALGLHAGGCVLVPRPEAAAEEVFRNAAGETIEVPWEWAR